MTTTDIPDGDDALAGEYVLHLLDLGEREQFEERLRDEVSLRDLVYQWEAHFAAMSDEIDAVTPPVAVKNAILAKIAPPQKKSPGLRGWLIGLTVAAAIAVLAVGTLLRGPEELTPSFQAEMSTPEGTVFLVAEVIPATHEIVIDRVLGEAPEGRVLQLWLIAEGADAPVSLGLLQPEGETRIRVPDDIAPGVRTGTIAISDEPPGGSPTGQPTGQVLATGTFVDL